MRDEYNPALDDGRFYDACCALVVAIAREIMLTDEEVEVLLRVIPDTDTEARFKLRLCTLGLYQERAVQ